MDEKCFEIRAKTVTVEVKDESTGKIYRRELPIDYLETANCLRLQAEDLHGKTSQLVFYSARGLERLQDLTGKGPDEDDCGTHI